MTSMSLAEHAICYHLCVCLSQGWIGRKWLTLWLHNYNHTVSPMLDNNGNGTVVTGKHWRRWRQPAFSGCYNQHHVLPQPVPAETRRRCMRCHSPRRLCISRTHGRHQVTWQHYIDYKDWNQFHTSFITEESCFRWVTASYHVVCFLLYRSIIYLCS